MHDLEGIKFYASIAYPEFDRKYYTSILKLLSIRLKVFRENINNLYPFDYLLHDF